MDKNAFIQNEVLHWTQEERFIRSEERLNKREFPGTEDIGQITTTAADTEAGVNTSEHSLKQAVERRRDIMARTKAYLKWLFKFTFIFACRPCLSPYKLYTRFGSPAGPCTVRLHPPSAWSCPGAASASGPFPSFPSWTRSTRSPWSPGPARSWPRSFRS